MRLGGPIFLESEDPAALAREHSRLGYGAAYCPPVTLDQPERIRAIREAYAREGLTCLPAGFRGSPHYHKHSEEWFIPLEGAAEFRIADGEWTRVEAGSIVFGPRHIPHALRGVGAEQFLMLCIVTPNVPDDETPI